MSSRGIFFWPDVSTLPMARRACREGGWAASLIAGSYGLLTTLAVAGVKWARELGFDEYGFADTAVFAAIGFWLFRCSRIAAVAGLVLYVIGRFVAPPINAMGILVPLLLIGYFCGAAKGAFAYHRLIGSSKTPNMVPLASSAHQEAVHQEASGVSSPPEP